MKLKYIAILLATILLATVAAYTVDYLLKIDTSGTYAGSLVASPTSIAWGSMNQNSPKSQIVTLTNNGPTISNLTIECDDMPDFVFDFDCNATEFPLAADESVTLNFTLTIYDGPAQPFNFSIYFVES